MLNRLSNTIFIAIFFFTAILTAPSAAVGESPGESEDSKIRLRYHLSDVELIEAPTRHLKPIRFTPEDVTVITAQDIQDMGAHTVAEVLNRVPGLFVNMGNNEFGGVSLLNVHGAEPRGTLILLDDIEINSLIEGSGETNWIPVQIIERIEVIRGQASAAHGSALLGVVKIVTKGSTPPDGQKGFLSASYGKNHTGDYRIELSGKEWLDYYLFAGFKRSEGLVEGRSFDDCNFFTRFNWEPSMSTRIALAMGASRPYLDFGPLEIRDLEYDLQERVIWTSLTLESLLTADITISINARFLQQRMEFDYDSLGLDFNGPSGSMYMNSKYDEDSHGVSGKIAWRHPSNTIVVIGSDADWGDLRQTVKSGETLQYYSGAPPTTKTNPDVEKWAVYLNTTTVIKKFSITTGVRYDDNSIDGPHFSYNLGFTYSLDKNTVFRATAGKGFGLPTLVWTSGGGLLISPNPDLESEEIWSYQAGVESNIFNSFRLKGAVFHHDIDNVIKRELYGAGPPSYNDLYVNSGEATRKGFELEMETVPFHGFSLFAGFAYVRFDPPNEYDATKNVTWDVALRYDDTDGLKAGLHGHYINRDLDDRWDEKDDMIWDLNISKEVWTREERSVEVFATGHNLFSGKQMWLEAYENPVFWMEMGFRMAF